MRVEDRHLAAEAVGQGDVVVAEPGDQLAAGVLDDRVVGGGDAAVLRRGVTTRTRGSEA